MEISPITPHFYYPTLWGNMAGLSYRRFVGQYHEYCVQECLKHAMQHVVCLWLGPKKKVVQEM